MTSLNERTTFNKKKQKNKKKSGEVFLVGWSDGRTGAKSEEVFFGQTAEGGQMEVFTSL